MSLNAFIKAEQW